MKKYMKRLFGLLMALCMMSSLFVPSARAAEAAGGFDGGAASPYGIIVKNGAKAAIQYLYAFPAHYDAEKNLYDVDSSLGFTNYFPDANQSGGGRHLSVEETQEILAKFKAKHGVEANAWTIGTKYIIYTDGKGSYGKYFEFQTGDTCLSGKTIRKDLSRTQTTCDVSARFLMPEKSDGSYNLSVSGGFYYYSAYAKKDLSSSVGVTVYFNWPT